MVKRNPFVAGLLGFVIYPLGYFYVGKFWRGLAVFFLVPLLLSPFMPDGGLVGSGFFAGNESVGDSNLSSVEANDSAPSDLRDLNQSAILDEIVSSYRDNPTLLFMDLFLRSMIALDCFIIASGRGRRKRNAAAGKKGAARKPREAEEPPVEKEINVYSMNANIKCPRCKIGLAVESPDCPNCGGKISPQPRPEKRASKPRQ